MGAQGHNNWPRMGNWRDWRLVASSQSRCQHTLSVKGQIVTVLGFVSCQSSLCQLLDSAALEQAATESTCMKKHGCVPIDFRLEKLAAGWIWSMSHDLLTPVLGYWEPVLWSAIRTHPVFWKLSRQRDMQNRLLDCKVKAVQLLETSDPAVPETKFSSYLHLHETINYLFCFK